MKKIKLLGFICRNAGSGKYPANRILNWGMNCVFGRRFIRHSDEIHLEYAIKWLNSAQDFCGEGVSAAFCLKNGWLSEYPETSGYIISTLLTYGQIYGKEDSIKRAVKIGDWEISIQSPDGGVYSCMKKKNTRVFNTGQVILGWCDLYEKTKDRKYLDAAEKAGDYLIACQEDSGVWLKNTYCGARTYHARTDWSLLRLAELTDKDKYAECAVKNIKWILTAQKTNGWFANCGFYSSDPVTHVIAYTLRGLLESDVLLKKNKIDLNILENIRHAADALCVVCDRDSIDGIKGLIPASFDENWNSKDNYSCITGNMQLAIFLYRLAQIMPDNHRFIEAAGCLTDAAVVTQFTANEIDGISGGIPGSWPIYGLYMPYSFPNWAGKFFVDALMMKLNLEKGLHINA